MRNTRYRGLAIAICALVALLCGAKAAPGSYGSNHGNRHRLFKGATGGRNGDGQRPG